MVATHECNGVAVYDSHEDAEAAIRRLTKAGFDIKKLSIIGREPHIEEHAVGFYNAGERAKQWGKRGAFWGTIVGILFAPIFVWIPGIGFVMIGGFMTSIILGLLQGALVGAAAGGGGTAIVAALRSLGIPKDSIIRYEKSIEANKFVLIAHGTQSEIERERSILERAGLGPMQLHEQAA
jgi:hypothetical protein